MHNNKPSAKKSERVVVKKTHYQAGLEDSNTIWHLVAERCSSSCSVQVTMLELLDTPLCLCLPGCLFTCIQ